MIKNIVFLLLSALSLVECKPVNQMKEVWYTGSIIGVESCINLKRSTLFEEESLKRHCIEKHQITLDTGLWRLSGSALVGSNSISGSVTSKYTDMIVSELVIEAIYFDLDGTKKTYGAISEVWIMPNSDDEFVAAYISEKPELSFDGIWCSEVEDQSSPKNCRAWGIVAAKGLSF